MKDKLIMAIGSAAVNYSNAAYYKTNMTEYFEGKVKGLLDLATDLGLYNDPDVVKYRKMVTNADAITQADQA